MVIILLILVLSTKKKGKPCFKEICQLGKVLDYSAVSFFGSHRVMPLSNFKNKLTIQQQHLQDPHQLLNTGCTLLAQCWAKG